MIGFIGAGQMARALAKGLVHADLFAAGQVWASDPVAEAREAFAALLPESTTVDDNLELVQQCRTVVLAVKPQQIERVIGADVGDAGARKRREVPPRRVVEQRCPRQRVAAAHRARAAGDLVDAPQAGVAVAAAGVRHCVF